MGDTVFIILVNYNGIDDTIDCINSIKGNAYQNIRIVVVDNGSNDDSYNRLVRMYGSTSDIVIIDAGENLGFAGGNNVGILYAIENDADYILLLNNDTIVDENFLIPLIKYSQKENKPLLLSAKILYYSDPSRIWYGGGKYLKYKGTARHLRFNELDSDVSYVEDVNFVCGCFMFFNRDAINKVGLMPEDYFLYGEDTAYSLVAVKQNVPMKYISDSVIYHKVSASTSKLSDVSTYYSIRNRFVVIKNYQRGLEKIIAYFASLYAVFKGIIRKDYTIVMAGRAIYDFCRGITGKYEEDKL